MRQIRSEGRETPSARAPRPGVSGRSAPNRWRLFRRSESGATAVEFALLALPFFILIFSIVEIALLFMGELTLDQAVDRIGREIRTGQLDSDEMTKEKFRKHLCDSVTALIDCDDLKIDLRAYSTYGDINPAPPANGDYSNFVYQRGGPDQIMALRVYYFWPVMTNIIRMTMEGDDGFLLASVAAFRTEKY